MISIKVKRIPGYRSRSDVLIHGTATKYFLCTSKLGYVLGDKGKLYGPSTKIDVYVVGTPENYHVEWFRQNDPTKDYVIERDPLNSRLGSDVKSALRSWINKQQSTRKQYSGRQRNLTK